jgi:hypothetical protein
MAKISVHHPALSGRPMLRRWLIGAVAAAVLAGAGIAIAFSMTGGSASTGQTPPVVSTWLQAHPDVAAWMRDHPEQWSWMRGRWSEATWMHARWDAMVWLQAHPGAASPGGMMSGMPMGTNLPEMRQWMSAHADSWGWMRSHWSDMAESGTGCCSG